MAFLGHFKKKALIKVRGRGFQGAEKVKKMAFFFVFPKPNKPYVLLCVSNDL
jgi:hypothetical protein